MASEIFLTKERLQAPRYRNVYNYLIFMLLTQTLAKIVRLASVSKFQGRGKKREKDKGYPCSRD